MKNLKLEYIGEMNSSNPYYPIWNYLEDVVSIHSIKVKEGRIIYPGIGKNALPIREYIPIGIKNLEPNKIKNIIRFATMIVTGKYYDVSESCGEYIGIKFNNYAWERLLEKEKEICASIKGVYFLNKKKCIIFMCTGNLIMDVLKMYIIKGVLKMNVNL